ncbi:MAG: glycoside hydrolase family 3 C-terminal domain-containing protein [Opitutaceae bacterium]|nr:glycoside hydrolase family 3 C-terminal domain-containing protein [Opitutaceae bacterium]
MNANADCPTCPKVMLLTGDLEYRRLPEGIEKAAWDQCPAYAETAFGRSFVAMVPGLGIGRYTVEIDLAEIVCRAEDQRLMDVWCGSVYLARNLDVFKAAGGFAKAYRLRGSVERDENPPGYPLTITFRGQRDAAMFCAIRIRNAAGAVIASLTADELHASEPLGAERIPDIKPAPIYADPSQPMEPRVDDLIRRMSLREKVAQMVNDAPAIDRLGVPAYDYWNECLHGVARAGVATVFPQAIGLAATWDPGLVHGIAGVIATEARAKHHDAIRRGIHAGYYGLTFWSPNINLFRDPRWGRGQETYGEDPFLTGRLAVAFITGLQGDDPRYVKILACAKHFAVHSGPESLRHTFDAEPSAQDLHDSYLPHFEAAVREAQVGAVMSAYNRVDGESATSSPLLLTGLLRKHWGFQGHVVSDCDAVSDIWLTHHLVATPEEAAARAVKAGCDLNCGNQYYALSRAVKKGLLTEPDIDRALRRIFLSRFRLGMFDPDAVVPYAQIPVSEVDSPAHAALALQVAQESIVLLKNTGILPLDRTRLKRLAVIGPNADSVPVLLGNYHGTPSHPVTIVQGIREAAGSGIEVVAAPGCPLAQKKGERTDPDSSDFRPALELARTSDAVIYVGGISPELEGEEMRVDYEGFSGGDRTRIELPAVQTRLLQALQATGKPVIFVNCSGSAIAMPWETEHLPALLQAWYPGQAGGTAVAGILFGDCNPSGRLPVTFYRSTEDLPPFEDYAMANRTYRFFTGRPLFVFGHGLSYTKFSYGPVRLDAGEVRADSAIRLSVDIANTGARDGDEIMQVYAHRLGADDPHLPRQRLCAFQRVRVPRGQRVVVSLSFPTSTLRRWDSPSNSYVVDPGEYELQVGASAADIRQTAKMRIVP